MYKQDREGMIGQIIQFSKIIRIFYIIDFIFMAFLFAIVLFSMLVGTAAELSLGVVGALGGLALVFLVIALIIQIYFFKYFGKAIRQTEQQVYTSPTPALVSLVFSAISILSSLKELFDGRIYTIINLLINLLGIYLVFGVYNGLKTIKEKGYFDAAGSTAQPAAAAVEVVNSEDASIPVVNDEDASAPVVNSEDTTAAQKSVAAKPANDDDTWIKED